MSQETKQPHMTREEWSEYAASIYWAVEQDRHKLDRLYARQLMILSAMDKAIQLAEIASDWNLNEVEIDGEMTDIYALRDEFRKAFEALRTSGYVACGEA